MLTMCVRCAQVEIDQKFIQEAERMMEIKNHDNLVRAVHDIVAHAVRTIR
jgi:hypothetical protein